MRIAALTVLALLPFAGCTSSAPQNASSYAKPNSLMADEITSRIEQIPYQHREELLLNLQWLSQAGEQAIPSLLSGLQHDNAKVRSSSAWVLGRIRDRRVIPEMRASLQDGNETVRLEVARTLLVLGDLATAPTLIEGLDSQRKEVRYLCHEALKSVTGRDFGYDHLAEDANSRRSAALSWRQWWGEYSGDNFFAQNYAAQNGLTMPAAPPSGEVKPIQPTPGQAPQQVPEQVPQQVPEQVPQQEPEIEPSSPQPVQPNGQGGGSAPPEPRGGKQG
ncbi:MAG: HEAT repeat domain-containing protein [Planctomycetes bacterium]|nr:HEAT repeat domain-containing protein [Planctomycetota bacterium]